MNRIALRTIAICVALVCVAACKTKKNDDQLAGLLVAFLNAGGSGTTNSCAAATHVYAVTRFGVGDASPSLFRCNLDGTGCTFSHIAAGQGTGSGGDPTMVIDSVNSKLLALTKNQTNNDKLSLFRCDLDGTNCTHTDISAGQGASSGSLPSSGVDIVNNKLLTATFNFANSGKPSIFRCDLDGTNCVHNDISAGQGTNSGLNPKLLIDTANSKLLVITGNQANSLKLAMFRCDLDATNCSHIDISAGQAMNSAQQPAAVIDSVNSKLLAVTYDITNSGRPSFFRCNLDGTSCEYRDISAGQGTTSGFAPSVTIDTTGNKLLVSTSNSSNNSNPSLFRCDLDGTNCSHTDLSAGIISGTGAGANPTIMYDCATNKIILATEDTSANVHLGLFRCDPDGTNCTHTDVSNAVSQGTNSGEKPAAALF